MSKYNRNSQVSMAPWSSYLRSPLRFFNSRSGQVEHNCHAVHISSLNSCSIESIQLSQSMKLIIAYFAAASSTLSLYAIRVPQANKSVEANVVQGYDTILPLLFFSIFGQIVTRVRVPAFALQLIFGFEFFFIIFCVLFNSYTMSGCLWCSMLVDMVDCLCGELSPADAQYRPNSVLNESVDCM